MCQLSPRGEARVREAKTTRLEQCQFKHELVSEEEGARMKQPRDRSVQKTDTKPLGKKGKGKGREKSEERGKSTLRRKKARRSSFLGSIARPFLRTGLLLGRMSEPARNRLFLPLSTRT